MNLFKNKGLKGKCRFREHIFGIFKENNNRDNPFWYVEFNKGKSIYCSQNILTFHSDTPQVVHLGSNKKNDLCLTKTNTSKETYLSTEDQI